MLEQTKLLSQLFDEKTVLVLEKILQKKDIFYLRDISRESGVSLATTYRIVQKLLKIGLVSKEIQGKFNYYKLIKSTPLYDEIFTLIIGEKLTPQSILKRIFKEKYGEVVKIYMEKKTKTKFFVVGENVNKDDVKKAVEKVIEESGTKAKINALALTPEQFNQMKDMGLISPERYEEL